MTISSTNGSFALRSELMFKHAEKSTEKSSGFDALLDGQSPEEILHEIVKDGVQGYAKWQMKKLEEKVREQVMSEMGITKDALGSMNANERAETEKKIMDEVARRLKEMIEKKMHEDAQKKGDGAIPLIDNGTSSEVFLSLQTS